MLNSDDVDFDNDNCGDADKWSDETDAVNGNAVQSLMLMLMDWLSDDWNVIVDADADGDADIVAVNLLMNLL